MYLQIHNSPLAAHTPAPEAAHNSPHAALLFIFTNIYICIYKYSTFYFIQFPNGVKQRLTVTFFLPFEAQIFTEGFNKGFLIIVQGREH